MKSSDECFKEAAKCEQLATSALRGEDRALMLSLAEQWKRLAEFSSKQARHEERPHRQTDDT